MPPSVFYFWRWAVSGPEFLIEAVAIACRVYDTAGSGHKLLGPPHSGAKRDKNIIDVAA